MHADIESFRMPEAGRVDTLASRLRLMADPSRLRILCALAQGESDVSCLAELSGNSQSSTSQHLSKLRLAGVVEAQRQGQRKVYTLVDPVTRLMIGDLLRREPAAHATSTVST